MRSPLPLPLGLERSLAQVHAPSLISTLCLWFREMLDDPGMHFLPSSPCTSLWSLFWDFLSLACLCMGTLHYHFTSKDVTLSPADSRIHLVFVDVFAIIGVLTVCHFFSWLFQGERGTKGQSVLVNTDKCLCLPGCPSVRC